MTWSTLPTYADGNALTGAQMNAVADNIEESAAARVTTAGQYVIGTAANVLAARIVTADLVSNTDTSNSTTYTNLANVGPTVVMTCQTQAMVTISALMFNNTDLTGTYMETDISGATTITPNDERGCIWQGTANNGERWGATTLYALTAGSNTFRTKYRVDTGGARVGTWKWRRNVVMGF